MSKCEHKMVEKFTLQTEKSMWSLCRKDRPRRNKHRWNLDAPLMAGLWMNDRCVGWMNDSFHIHEGDVRWMNASCIDPATSYLNFKRNQNESKPSMSRAQRQFPISNFFSTVMGIPLSPPGFLLPWCLCGGSIQMYWDGEIVSNLEWRSKFLWTVPATCGAGCMRRWRWGMFGNYVSGIILNLE